MKKPLKFDANNVTMKLLLVLFLFLPISVSCEEKSCEDLSAENRSTIVLKIRDFIQLYKNSDVISAWNEDEIIDKMSNMNYIKLSVEDKVDTNAVIITNSATPEMTDLLKHMIDIEAILKMQKIVNDGKMTPRY